MKILTKIPVLILSLSLNSVFALSTEFQNKLIELQNKYPDASPYQILKHGFEESKDTIMISDLYDNKLVKNCAITYASVDEKSKIDVVPSDRTVFLITSKKLLSPEIPAQPSRGPLFPSKPAIPAKYSEKLMPPFFQGRNVPSNEVKTYYSNYYDSEFENISSHFTNNELIFSLVHPKDYSVIYQFRKNGDMLFIKHLYKSYNMGYGYCWHE